MSVINGAQELPDAALVTAAKQGDKRALVELYTRYVGEIYGFLYNQVGNAQDAEDLTSETFLRLVRALNTYRGESSFRTWLYAVARNSVRDLWRQNGRHPTVPLESVSPGLGTGDFDVIGSTGEVAADEMAAGDLQASALGQAVLAALQPRYRQVLELRVMAGRSVRDVAEVMAVSEANVKVLQHRALKKAAEIAEKFSAGGG